MANPWILHGDDEAECGCTVVYSIYRNVGEYVEGRVRMDAHLCAEHEIPKFEYAEPLDLDTPKYDYQRGSDTWQ